MQTTYRLKASELNQKILDGIKAIYKDSTFNSYTEIKTIW
jgi:hypothetical protein